MVTRRVHCKKEPYDVYIGRGGQYGNPYVFQATSFPDTVRVKDRDEAVSLHMRDLRSMDDEALRNYLMPLVGKTLGCFCGPRQRCHGDNYITLIKELGLE